MKIEKSLLEACLKQERVAQNQLYKELFSYLMNICMRYKNDYDTAGASLNAIYLKILNNLDRFEHQDSFIAWIKRIAVNHLIDEYRKEKRERSKLSFSDKEQWGVKQATYHTREAEMESEYLLQMIKKLPEASAQVFNLYAIDGYKHREIAEMLDMNENTSKWHLREARIKLRAMLEVYHEKT
ncbi:MAG: RNA polymerase sigma factor [Bacteroidetes bacterium]|nr:MAG: RNA polymerase sigma factor [Bacteroidota bacterium]MBL1143523.1 RNA polymerase sigma factor [Bacteroidota bacterium]NOG56325.1 RNA polymerase sigma factor [Bacteroidota bacterium]